MTPSAVVHCLLTLLSLSESLTKTATDPDQLRAIVKTFTRGKSVLESTLEIVPVMENQMVIPARSLFLA